MIKLFSKSRTKVNTVPQINPTRDWFRLLGVFFVLLVLSIGYNYWMFQKVTSGQGFGSQTKVVPLTGVSLQKVEDVFTARATELNLYMHEYRFVDPSRVSR